MDQLKRINQALTTLLFEEPFFAILAMRLKIAENNNFPTFATDGENLFFNSEFCESLKHKEIMTVLAHEVMHCAKGHLWRMPSNTDFEKWNIATDNEINHELEDINLKMGTPSPWPWPSTGKELQTRFKGMAAEKIYNILMSEKQENKQGQKPNPKNGKQDTNNKNFGEVIPLQKPEEKGKQEREWKKAIIDAYKATKPKKGHLPGDLEEIIEKLLSNKIDWKNILKDKLFTIAKDDYSFKKPNVRYSMADFILPCLESEKMGEIIFAIDTSGSIDQDLLKDFLGLAQEALDDLRPEKLIVIQCDTKIHTVNEFESGDNIDLKIYGRGGTDFSPVFEYIEKKSEEPIILIYLTDLCGSWPSFIPDYPVLWVTKKDLNNVPFGEVIEIN